MSSADTSVHRDDRVAVVGGGIAGLAAAWELSRAGRAVTLLDAAPRFGGKIASERRGGFLVESGPDSFVTRKPQAVELARELGLGDRLLETREENHRVRILHRGRLVDLPSDGGSALPCRLAPIWGSELLSWRGKLRLTLERYVPRRRAEGDESLGAFLRRRFGREVMERFAGPVLAGIYLADPETLSLRAAFPQFAEIEKRHGSVMRAMQASQARGMPTPAAARVSLQGGVGELVEALVAALEASGMVELRSGVAVESLTRGADGWRLETATGPPVDAASVILAAPAWVSAPWLGPHAPEAAAVLAAIRYVSTAAVSLGYENEDLTMPLDGFGFVVPASEGRRITACTWSSAKFEGRAEPGEALLRVFLGGPKGERWLEAKDDYLVQVAREELADLMSLRGEPLLAKVHRHWRGTPQYEVGHQERIAAAEAALPEGLHLAGSAYHGIGIPDCIASGRRAAAAVR
ncbi:MAG TPA: protoporphyrinogen oxidase [Thermoanaerobaculia bacterium]|nr:protoporphyrinogen oxidase [Thermoanaerobaculia bacterium]